MKTYSRCMGLCAALAAYIGSSSIQPACAQNSFPPDFQTVSNRLKVDKSSLIVFVNMKSDRPYADLIRLDGNIGIDSMFRKNIKTRVSQAEKSAPIHLDLNTWRPVFFIVDPPAGTHAADISFKIGDPDSPDVRGKQTDGDILWYYDQTPRHKELTYRIAAPLPALAPPAPGAPALPREMRTFDITLVEAKEADFTTEFGIFYIVRASSQPAFGLTKSVFALGASKRLTLDLVTVFGTDKDKDTTLGGALTYGTILGSRRVEGYRGIFGFPVKLSFTIGFEGLDLSRVNRSKGGFLGVGISIPTSTR